MESRHLKIVLRWVWLLLLIPIIAGISGFLYARNQPPIYRATSRLIIGPGIDSPNPSLDSLRTGALLMQTYAELAETETFRQEALNAIGLDIPTVALADIVSLRPVVDTQILNVVVNYTDPAMATALANQVADGLVALSPSAEYNSFLRTRIQDQANRLEENIVQTEQRLNDLKTEFENERDPGRQSVIVQRIAEEEGNLSNSNASLAAIYDTLQSPFTNQVEIVDRATTAIPVGSELALTLLIALGAGVIISIMLAVLLIYFDTLVIDYDTVRRQNKYPVWGRVRQKASVFRSDVRMLSSFVIHQHNEHEVKSILLTGIEDSKQASTIAAELATTLARAGNKVMLLDADFSNNVIERRFPMQNMVCLTDILKRDTVPFDIKPVPDHPNLIVIPSGESQDEDFFLIAAQRLQQILGQYKDSVDYIIVTAPALASFEEAMVMADWMDSGVIIAQQGKTRVADLNKAIEFFEAVSGKMHGLVVAA